MSQKKIDFLLYIFLLQSHSGNMAHFKIFLLLTAAVFIVTANANTITIENSNTDMRAVIQNTLNQLAAAGGGTLQLQQGLYLLDGFIEVGSNTNIIGAGMDKTTLRLVDKAAPWWIPNTGNRRSGILRAKRSHNLVFAHFTLDGNRDNQNNDKYSLYGRYGFYTEACDNVFLDSIAIVNFQGYGFDPHGIKDTDKIWSNNLTIINSVAKNNAWDGYTIDQCNGVLLRNNTAIDNGRHGFNIVTGTRNLIMIDVKSFNNGHYYYKKTRGCGVMIQNNLYFGTNNVTFENGVIANSSDAGVCINDVKNIHIRNVTVNKTDNRSCIRVRNVTLASITKNRCVGTPRGIRVGCGTDVIVTENVFLKE